MNRIFLFDPCKTRYSPARMALPERILADSSSARAHLARKNLGRFIGLVFTLVLGVFQRRSRPASQPTRPGSPGCLTAAIAPSDEQPHRMASSLKF